MIGKDVVIGGSFEGNLIIGDDLESPSEISIGGDGGLVGQIIINANDSSNAWQSGATVVVGTTSPVTLTGDEYTQTADSLGGGSVGLVPFSTHRESCSPAHGTVKKGAPASITLQFYGPVVQADEGTDMPVRVYRGEYGDDTFASDVDITDDCEVVMHPGGDPRKVRINPVGTQFRPKYRYHLVPITSSPGTGETILLCDGLLASGDVPVKGRDYWVDVDITFGMLDLGGNGWVDTPDVAMWAADPVDFNGDSAADSADLQMIVDNLGEPVE